MYVWPRHGAKATNYSLPSEKQVAAHYFARPPTRHAVFFSQGHFQRHERHGKILGSSRGSAGFVSFRKDFPDTRDDKNNHLPKSFTRVYSQQVLGKKKKSWLLLGDTLCM